MKMSPSGDLGAQRAEQGRKAFRRPIKAAGRTGACAKPLRYREPAKASGGTK